MALIGLVGNLGTGKTLGMTYVALQNLIDYGTRVFANYKLNFPYTPITTIEELNDMKEGAFYGDELWTWLDSRCSQTERNRQVAKILKESRKRDLDIYYTTQHIMQCDVRIRRMTDFIVEPFLSVWKVVGFQLLPLKCTLQWWTFIEWAGHKRPFNIQEFYTLPIINLYDTKEEIGDLASEERL